MKKIALFMLPLLTQGGGAEKYFIELAKNLRKRGIEADIITPDENFFRIFARILHILTRGNFFRPIDIKGRETEEAVRISLGGASWLKVGFWDLKKNLNRYDVIYSKNELTELLLLKMIGYKKIPPVVVGIHTPLYFPLAKTFFTRLHNFLYLGFFYRWLIRGVKFIHASNLFTKRMAEEKIKIESRLIYYPFSIKREIIENEKKKLEFDFSPEKINLIFLGRLSEQKGIDRLFPLIEKIFREKSIREKIRLNILGSSGDEWEEKTREAQKNFPFVRFFGHIPNQYISQILSQNDLMLSLSRWEVLPFNILEAQAAGLPVLAFDIPGPKDIIENDQTGYLVRNIDEFWQKIKLFIYSSNQFEKEKIKEVIQKKFDPNLIYPQIIQMFDEASQKK